jgi:hypothetical protein
MLDVEADCYWCLSKLLDGIQDHYTDAQPGIQRTVFKVKELVRWGVLRERKVAGGHGSLIAHYAGNTILQGCSKGMWIV